MKIENATVIIEHWFFDFNNERFNAKGSINGLEIFFETQANGRKKSKEEIMKHFNLNDQQFEALIYKPNFPEFD